MKKIFLVLILFPLLGFSQYALVDFIALNDGSEEDYHKLEKVWKVYHQKSIDAGEKSGWAVWKRTPKDNDGEFAADYVVFNQFGSEEQMNNYLSGGDDFSINEAISTMRSNLKGMSKRSIRKIVESEGKIKKQVRTYHIEMVDATPFDNLNIKIGDKMTFAPMIQKTDDYEQVESYIAKPYFMEQIKNGKHKWWGFTRIINRSDKAYKNLTHIAWNMYVPDAQHDDYVVENEFIQKVLNDKISSSREMRGAQELTLVYQND